MPYPKYSDDWFHTFLVTAHQPAASVFSEEAEGTPPRGRGEWGGGEDQPTLLRGGGGAWVRVVNYPDYPLEPHHLTDDSGESFYLLW